MSTTNTRPTPDVIRLAQDAAQNVFSTMLNLPLAPVPENPALLFSERLTGTVGFGGEKVSGAVYVHMSCDFARQIAGAMIGIPASELSADSEVNDVVGEICNMIAGAVKSSLCDTGIACALSTPSLIRGAAFEIDVGPDVRREQVVLESQGNRILIEVHIKPEQGEEEAWH